MSAVKKIHKLCLPALSIFCLTSCGYLNKQFGLELPESEMSSTGVGATTGAVLGGGIGALIGSTGGNAGEGLMIGALAGATAGGIVGNEFDSVSGTQGNQAEEVRKQREIIRRQQDEIDNLRYQQGDTVSNNPNNIYGVNPDLPALENTPALENNSQTASLDNQLPQAKGVIENDITPELLGDGPAKPVLVNPDMEARRSSNE